MLKMFSVIGGLWYALFSGPSLFFLGDEVGEYRFSTQEDAILFLYLYGEAHFIFIWGGATLCLVVEAEGGAS